MPARRELATPAEVRVALQSLDGGPVQISAADWPSDLTGIDEAGMYSWWADEAGAQDLSAGLGLTVGPGRIYAGQTGATKWPSGRVGNATIRSRIRGNHLNGNIGSSTFRRTLAASLRQSLGLVAASGRLDAASEALLSEWMRARLYIAVHSFSERDALGDLELQVLRQLDPPLNLGGMPFTPVRARLQERRRDLGAKPRERRGR